MGDFKYIGTRPVRPDGLDKVTGRARYGADQNLPGMLHGKVLRSPHAHARIVSIDLKPALALPGVLAAVSSADFPEILREHEDAGDGEVEFHDLSRNILARGKVLYHGHAIAAVAAVDEALAQAALEKIQVVYEVLPHVVDLTAAMTDEAPVLHEDMFTEGLADTPTRPSNIASRSEFKRGDLEQGFSEADIVIERSYLSPTAHQGYIEPHACTVSTGTDGKIDIWCSSQGQFLIRRLMSKVLAMEVSDIRVTPAEIGGGFGGKTTMYLEPVAAVLSRISGRPVKMVMSREEVFRASGPASAGIINVRIGATRDGKLTAMDGEVILGAGAFAGSPARLGTMCMFSPYTCPNLRAVGLDVVTNTAKTAAYRAPGAPQAHLGVECAINELADHLGLDPIELRMRNAVDEGDATIYGPRFKAIGLKQILESARNHPHYQRQLKANQGRGVAVGFWFNIGLQSSATLNVAESGHVTLITGNPDIGGSRASMALMAAEALGIPPQDINPLIGNTESIAYCDQTGGSRTTFASGLAVVEAATELIDELRKRAAALWEVESDEVAWRDGHAHPPARSDKPAMSLAELAGVADRTGGPLTASASLNAKGAGPAFALSMVDVEVDHETGRTQVIAATAFQDVGTAIHPAYVEGQLQGGLVQGLGWALNEEYVYDDAGVLLNAGFLDYRIPVASDLPMIDTVLIEVPNPTHPYGVRGVGEAPICPPMAAVATAVGHATNRVFTALPLSPTRVLAQILDGE